MYIGGKQRGRFRCLLRKRSSKDRIPVAEPSKKNTEKKSEAELCALAKWFQIMPSNWSFGSVCLKNF